MRILLDVQMSISCFRYTNHKIYMHAPKKFFLSPICEILNFMTSTEIINDNILKRHCSTDGKKIKVTFKLVVGM